MSKRGMHDIYTGLTSDSSSSSVGQMVGQFLGPYEKSNSSATDTQGELVSAILGQEFAERSAAIANQYNIDAERRERDWNDVGAQIERGRRAGVSPSAVLGNTTPTSALSTSVSSMTPSVQGHNVEQLGATTKAISELGSLALDAVDSGFGAYESYQRAGVSSEQKEYYKQLSIGQAIENEVDEYSKSFDMMTRRYIADKTKYDAAQSEFKANTQEELHDLDVQEREERIRQIGVNIDNTINATNADVQLKETMRVELWTQAALNLANSNRADAAAVLDYARANLTNLESVDLGIKLKYADVRQQLEIKSLVAGITLQGAQTLASLSQTELNASLVQLNLDEHDLNIIEKDLAQFRATFEKEHKEKDWRFDRRMQRKQTRAYGKMADAAMLNGLSNVTMAACRAVGTMATFGFGGVGASTTAGALPPYVTGFGVPQYK